MVPVFRAASQTGRVDTSVKAYSAGRWDVRTTRFQVVTAKGRWPGVRFDHRPYQQVADKRHEAHCDDEMPKYPAERLKTGSSNESTSHPRRVEKQCGKRNISSRRR